MGSLSNSFLHIIVEFVPNMILFLISHHLQSKNTSILFEHHKFTYVNDKIFILFSPEEAIPDTCMLLISPSIIKIGLL